MFYLIFYSILVFSVFCKEENVLLEDLKIFFLVLIIILSPFIICKSIFLGIIIHYDLSYDCSDELTNEVFRKENENVKISIKFISINLGLEIFNFLLNSISLLISYLIKDYGITFKCFERKKEQNNTIIRINSNRNNVNNRNKNIGNNNLNRNNNQVERINKEKIRRIIMRNRNMRDSQSSKGSTNDNTSYFSD